MSKRNLKLMIWLALLLAAAGLAWAAVRGAAGLLAYFQRGADPASALNIVPNVPPDLFTKISWRPDPPEVGRAVEPFTRSQLQAAYQRAWLQWNLSYLKGEPYGLKTYFTGPALAAAGEAVRAAAEQRLKVEQIDTEHDLELQFYNAGGAVAAFTDHNALVAQVIRDASGAVVYAGETRADYDVVMLLEDGVWHVRHWLRRDAASSPASVAPSSRPGFVVRDGARLLLDGQPFQIAGVDYYPRNTPWDKFWAGYSSAETDRDLTLVRSLGLNTVRTFIPFQQFGGPKPEPAMLDRLQDFLDRAEVNRVKVILTLFDFRTDYRPLLWPESDRHAEALLARFRDHPAVLAWDLKNEPNNDYAASGRATVDAWLAHTARVARAADPNHLITIGWLGPDAAHNLAGEVDFISFHFFAPADQLAAGYAGLRARAPGKPIALTEFGLPTWNSIFPNGHSEAEQARYYADILAAARASDTAGAIAWTLYDFSYVPREVAGRMPWRTGPERQLGLVRADDSLKPAARLLAPGAALDAPAVPAWARWVKPFWLLVFALGLVCAALAGRLGWRRLPEPLRVRALVRLARLPRVRRARALPPAPISPAPSSTAPAKPAAPTPATSKRARRRRSRRK